MQAGADAGCQKVRVDEKGFGPAAEQILSLLRATK